MSTRTTGAPRSRLQSSSLLSSQGALRRRADRAAPPVLCAHRYIIYHEYDQARHKTDFIVLDAKNIEVCS